MRHNPLSNILIAPNVISKYGVEDIVSHIEKTQKSDLSVFDAKKSNSSGDTHWKVDKSIRDTQISDIRPIMPKIEELFIHTVKNIINPFYGINLIDSEIPQLLSYEVGGHYKPHIDGEALWKPPNGEAIWKKSVDRDLSIVFFLNKGGKDFEGGDLVFPNLGVRVRPEPGTLVCFPSNRFYVHGVEPVTQGMRYSIVSWGRVRGMTSLERINKKLGEKYGVTINN